MVFLVLFVTVMKQNTIRIHLEKTDFVDKIADEISKSGRKIQETRVTRYSVT